MFYHLSSTRPLTAAVVATFLVCHAASGQRPASPAELKALVKNYTFRNKPKLNPETQFAIEEYAIAGLQALNVQIILRVISMAMARRSTRRCSSTTTASSSRSPVPSAATG